MSDADKSLEWISVQLDKSAEDFTFPDLGHGYYFAIDARLHAHSDPDRWALVVEVVGYNPRGGDVLDVLHTYGNCLTSGDPGIDNEDFLGRIDNFEEVEDEDEPETATGADVVVRGSRIRLSAQPGEELSAMFRRLVPSHRHLLLADDVELRRRIPTDIPEILRLEEWHQPDLFETKPSQSEVYRQVAEVLATADPARYRPTEAPNTYWSNWPDSGSL
ncbi:DUF7003 family protein [Intrasporangium calvum]|uniref:Uncharacterized protein n=1 Tax=Intrasporangium calvum (strain ATCC 23552 / DSM 43043 / JCM 3097 / NBRC 12989 / NCIMB 10167 / NRRL B-3866 / 7 KIP) TaxID=710696 RepID=E6SC56_INTC7|nr:hypothetical protein [Intrasporangium calvum]ADU47400.1 hypothetical protein Intca_0871 [Intrasporangium calvum DSM 43043]